MGVAASSNCCLAGLLAGRKAEVVSSGLFHGQKGSIPDEFAKLSPVSACSTTVPSSVTTDESTEDESDLASPMHLTTPVAAKLQKPAVVAPEDAVILFDWDDTLMPLSVVNQFTPELLEALERGEASETRDELAEHAALVGDTLRAARKLARVFIVTLSARPWIPESANRFLPLLDIEALLKELDIEVVYAGESPPCPGEGIAQYIAQKRWAMTKCMNLNYNARQGRVVRRRNVLSIGDSDIEQHALTEVLDQWGRFRPAAQKPLVKTLKLREKPSLADLGEQLRFLVPRLPKIVAKGSNFEFTIDESTDLTTVSKLNPVLALDD